MATAATTPGAEQIVGLELAGEMYGVNIGLVQEIIRMQAITSVPNCPAFVEGLTTLRGRVIPVMDLRKRFDLPAGDPTSRTRIVVAELAEHTVGLIVDGVSEVLWVKDDQVEPPSTLVTMAESDCLRGVAKLDERLILLLDLTRLLSEGEQEELAA
ncbi:MAG: chemotaxis protein CheW [Chloroflexota bacterium]